MLRRGNTDYFNDSLMAYAANGTSLPANFPPVGGTDANSNNCVWVGLSTTIPDQEGNNVTEPASGGYARQPLIIIPQATFSNQFYQAGYAMYANTVGVQFPVPTANYSSNAVQAVTFWDLSSSGNLLSWDAGFAPFFALLGQGGPFFPPGSIRLGINTGWGRRGMISEFLADGLNAYLWKNTAFSGSAQWVALCSSVPLPSDTDIHATREIQSPILATNGVNYARVSIGTVAAIKAGRYANSGVVQPNYPTGAWGDAVAWALMSGQGTNTGNYGKVWFAGLLNPPRTIDQYRPCPPFGNKCLQLGLGQ